MGTTAEAQTDERKLKALILYIATKLKDDPLFGYTKLNKVLYFCDFQAYGSLGVSITGATYQRLDFGPAPRGIVPLRRQLEDSGAIAIESAIMPGGYVLRRIVARTMPDTSVFSTREMEIIDSIIAFARTLTASELSELSHREIGWIMTPPYEDIPYRSFFIGNEPLTEENIALGQQFAEADKLAIR